MPPFLPIFLRVLTVMGVATASITALVWAALTHPIALGIVTAYLVVAALLTVWARRPPKGKG